ncbi:MAG: class I tRNA ligase family protein, partial [Planctomycetes bacterium]|nr:class I tRNA ligase family protein [Planctomycetota bacterium]
TYNGNQTGMVVAEELREHVCEKAGITDAKLVKSFKGEDLTGLSYEQPLWGFDCPVVFADYVTLTDGTGLVHTAPGHGKEDFETGKKEGIPPVCPVSPTGVYYKDDRLREELQLAEDYADERGWFELINNQHIYKINDAIADKLNEQGSLLFSEKFMHSYPHCWRTHKPVIFRVTEQWFVDVDHVDPDTKMNPDAKPLRERILDEIKNVEWFPAWGEKRITAMVSGRPDWCISRQRNWGIPIPAFFDVETGETCLTLETIDHIIGLVAVHGSNVWFDDENWPVDKLLPDNVRPDRFKGKQLSKMDDIFDVWFESGSSHRSVMLSDDELKDKFPANLYLEGDDQHRGWFQVSLILSVATQGRSPFKQCLTSAFVVDEKGQKGSKSKGNIWAIDKGCNEVGADLIRLYFASVNTSEPIPVTFDLIRGASDGYRKLRNTWRTMVANLNDFTAEHDLVEYDELPVLDKWALSKAAKMIDDVTSSFNRYEFHTGMRALVHFVNITMSSQYVDVAKDPLYCAEAASVKRRGIQTVYWTLGNVLMRMFAPVIPHTADEMWAAFPHWDNAHQSVHLASWPESGKGLLIRNEGLEMQVDELFAIKAEVDRTLDRLRKDKKIGKSYDTNVTLGLDAELSARLAKYASPEGLEQALAEVMNVSRVHLDTESEHGALQEFEPAADVQGLWVKVEISDEEACVRCYRRTGDVGSVSKHPYLCGRCAGVVG